MKHLLINGCSYGNAWQRGKKDQDIANKLNSNTFTNLSNRGSSNGRIYHSTMEFISKNPDVDFVILSLTFCHRFEGPWADVKDIYDGRWICYASHGIPPHWLNRMKGKNSAELDKINKYIQDRIILDAGIEYVNRYLENIITFSSWLDSKNIRYCIFNACEGLKNIIATEPDIEMEKISWIKENKRIIDIENFISNQWMHDNGANIPYEGLGLDPKIVHYDKDGYALLNDFLYSYITENCL